MYSLYRAWFGAEESYPRLETLSPPDTLVRVGNEGEYHFAAHRAVLAAHSGYLKALLATTAAVTAGDGSTPAATPDGTPPLITSVTVPSTIGGEAFAPLLNYMYTGRLEVTLDNIYTVLLATHLLHMPGALEQCRAALLRLRAPPAVPEPQQQQQQQQQQSAVSNGGTGNSSILRPVPNRLLGPAFCWPSQATYPPPRHLELPHLPALQVPASIAVLPAPLVHKTALPYGFFFPDRSKEPSASPVSNSSQAAAQQRTPLSSPELVVASSSASSTTQRSGDEQPPTSRDCPSPSPSSERISVSDSVGSEQQRQQQQAARRRRAAQQHQQHKQAGNSRRQAERSSSTSSTGGGGTQSPGVVYDVACCDGPVRFHRVLNENYAPAAAQQQRALSQCNGRSPSCRELPAELTINCRENDENVQSQQQQQQSVGDGPINNNGAENRPGGGSYTCGYCRHTFKSQYCYRKHARRHLLPTDGGTERHRQAPAAVSPPQPPPPPPQSPQQQQQQVEGKKREVRLLDLNVQYYPCKICGSKFPSYYFVHKHRKLCHANIDEPTGQAGRGTDSSQEQIKETKAEQEEKQQLQQQQPGTSKNAQQQPA